ncbi:hypothetical protein GCM10025862_38600 [Arsenicicoccus piscis]|uniref:Uncharacterized protein n=1 Tax=Arsenicicoccus piscis TaxID=673954 RepID=A0ABQ6HVW5_9MICO|nr:hypothetical protein GCM10025862_38600 [Arsenicicoccus piscis]
MIAAASRRDRADEADEADESTGCGADGVTGGPSSVDVALLTGRPPILPDRLTGPGRPGRIEINSH